ncbi:MAG: hypothetical protein LUD46_02930, partial [Parabacteroides sp.]|nr:hypothetical protein [Parabacteroides sp.]
MLILKNCEAYDVRIAPKKGTGSIEELSHSHDLLQDRITHFTLFSDNLRVILGVNWPSDSVCKGTIYKRYDYPHNVLF